MRPPWNVCLYKGDQPDEINRFVHDTMIPNPPTCVQVVLPPYILHCHLSCSDAMRVACANEWRHFLATMRPPWIVCLDRGDQPDEINRLPSPRARCNDTQPSYLCSNCSVVLSPYIFHYCLLMWLLQTVTSAISGHGFTSAGRRPSGATSGRTTVAHPRRTTTGRNDATTITTTTATTPATVVASGDPTPVRWVIHFRNLTSHRFLSLFLSIKVASQCFLLSALAPSSLRPLPPLFHFDFNSKHHFGGGQGERGVLTPSEWNFSRVSPAPPSHNPGPVLAFWNTSGLILHVLWNGAALFVGYQLCQTSNFVKSFSLMATLGSSARLWLFLTAFKELAWQNWWPSNKIVHPRKYQNQAVGSWPI